jgi:hypothetical protein
MRNAYKVIVGNLQVCGLEANIKLDLDLGCEDMDWIHLLQVFVWRQALVSTVMNRRVL